MSLTLYFHPLSSFCQKVLIALYENDTPFNRHVVDLTNEAESAAFKQLWPIGKFPVLRDEANDRLIRESSNIIEYLHLHYPGRTAFLPADPELARRTRMRDRFFDLYVNSPMQKIVTDNLRPEGKNDAFGVGEAKKQLATALGLLEREMIAGPWVMGEAFGMADCAAAPSLFYTNKVMPFEETHRHVAAYFDRLLQRPSFARTLQEAEPYLKLFPM